jgi:hypothetical protein
MESVLFLVEYPIIINKNRRRHEEFLFEKNKGRENSGLNLDFGFAGMK